MYSFGKNRDGAFQNEDLMAQMKDCAPMFKELHPDAEHGMAFDNSMNHHKRASDAFDVSVYP